MRISAKLFTLLAAGFAVLVVVVFVFARYSTVWAFQRYEERAMENAARGVLELHRNEMGGLLSTAYEWSTKEDIRRLATTENTENKEWSVDADDRLLEMRINVICVAGARGDIEALRFYQPDSEMTAAVPDYVREFMLNDNLLRTHHHADSREQGLVLLDGRAMLLASVPIQPSEEGGLLQGAVIMGKWLQNADFMNVVNSVGLSMHVYDYEGLSGSRAEIAQSILAAGRSVYVQASQGGDVRAYIVLNNIYGKPALLIQFSRPRTEYLSAVDASLRTGGGCACGGCRDPAHSGCGF